HLSLGPTTLNFGAVIIGQVATRSFQLTNTGGVTLSGSATTTLPFAIQSGTPFNLLPGETSQVTVSFTPTSAGNFSNAVIFTSNGGNSTNSLIGSGLTPPQLAVSPARLNFGVLAVGANVQASFTVTNRGGAPLSNGVASVGGGAPGFTILAGTPFNLAGFGSTNVTVRFAPATVGSLS